MVTERDKDPLAEGTANAKLWGGKALAKRALRRAGGSQEEERSQRCPGGVAGERERGESLTHKILAKAD